MSTPTQARDTTLELRARLPTLHDDPQRIHALLDVLDMPPGTEVRVTTVAASVIVR